MKALPTCSYCGSICAAPMKTQPISHASAAHTVHPGSQRAPSPPVPGLATSPGVVLMRARYFLNAAGNARCEQGHAGFTGSTSAAQSHRLAAGFTRTLALATRPSSDCSLHHLHASHLRCTSSWILLSRSRSPDSEELETVRLNQADSELINIEEQRMEAPLMARDHQDHHSQ